MINDLAWMEMFNNMPQGIFFSTFFLIFSKVFPGTVTIFLEWLSCGDVSLMTYYQVRLNFRWPLNIFFCSRMFRLLTIFIVCFALWKYQIWRFQCSQQVTNIVKKKNSLQQKSLITFIYLFFNLTVFVEKLCLFECLAVICSTWKWNWGQ